MTDEHKALVARLRKDADRATNKGDGMDCCMSPRTCVDPAELTEAAGALEEADNTIHTLKDRAEAAEAKLAEVREALEAMLDEFGSNFPDGESTAVDMARAALVKPGEKQ